MEQQPAPIELRSERVRRIIGSHPPILIRMGIYTILCIAALLIGGSALFKYTPTYNFDAELVPSNPYNALCIIKIHAHMHNKIRAGQQFSIDYDIANIAPGRLSGTADSLQARPTVERGAAYTLAYSTLPTPFALADTFPTTVAIAGPRQSYLSRLMELLFGR